MQFSGFQYFYRYVPSSAQSNFRSFLVTPKKVSPNLFCSHSPPSCTKSSATTNLFCLYGFAYPGHLIIGIIQFVVFCDQLLALSVIFSRFIHVEPFYCVVQHSYRYTTISELIHLLMDIQISSSLGLLKIKPLWTLVYIPQKDKCIHFP